MTGHKKSFLISRGLADFLRQMYDNLQWQSVGHGSFIEVPKLKQNPTYSLAKYRKKRKNTK